MSGNWAPTARPLASALAFLGASVASALAATLRLGGMADGAGEGRDAVATRRARKERAGVATARRRRAGGEAERESI